MDAKAKELEKYITNIPDFPQKGVLFRDITSLIQHPVGFKLAIDLLKEKLAKIDFDVIVGLESRGFIFGAPLAYELGKGFITARKKGKLPREVITEEYDLEYGKAALEVHKDSITKGMKVVIIDDLIATGGTFGASVRLVERLGGVVVCLLSVIELAGFDARNKVLKGYNVESLLKYEGK
jgi:adenine phosphoribosyltransferase